MALIKNNLWRLFCFLLLGGLILLSVLLVYEWKNIKKDYLTSSQNRVEFSAQASAARPYTVSVGKATHSPAFNSATAWLIRSSVFNN